MRIQNNSGLSYAGWLPSTVVATLPHTEGTVGGVNYVAGSDIGLRGRHIDVFGTFGANSDVTVDVSAASSNPFSGTARDAIAADPIAATDALGAVPTMCGENLAVVSATAEGAGVLIHCRGRITSMLVVDVFIRKYAAQHWAFAEVLITASNPSVGGEAGMRGIVPNDCVLRIADAISSFQAPTTTDHTVLLPAGEHLADGQSRAFTGVIYWPGRMTAAGGYATQANSINAHRTGLLRAIDEGWATKIGPLQSVARAGSNFNAGAWTDRHFSEARIRLTNWSAGDLSIAADSSITGAQGDQSFGGKGTACFMADGGPRAATALYWDALGNARRPCHHRETDGSLLSLSTHPSLFLWFGRPHFAGNNSLDRLGKPRALTIAEAHGWNGPDEEHIFYFTLAAAYQLTGSRACQMLLETQARNYFYSRGTTGAAARNGADRAIGWMAALVATLYVTLRDRSLAESLKTHATNHFNAVTLPAIQGRPIWSPRTESNLRADIWRNQSDPVENPYPSVFFAYQAAQAAGGLYIFGVVLNIAAARAEALNAARTVIERAYSQHPPSPGDSRSRFVEWDYLGNPAGNTALSVSAYVEGAGAHRAPTGQPLHLPGWFAHAWFPFAAWVVLREQPAHARANAIWAQINADVVNSTGILEWFPPVTPDQAAAAPTNLQVVATQSTNTLTWVDNASNEASYDVERADTATMAFEVIASLAQNSTEYVDSAITIGQRLTYRVAAVTVGGLRSYSNQVNVVVPGLPTTPTSFTAIAHATLLQVALAWADASAGQNTFIVQWSPDGVSNWSDLAIVPAGRTTHNDTSITRGVRRYYRIASRYQGFQSPWSAVIWAQLPGLLTPPTNLAAIASSNLPEIALTWSNLTNGAINVELEHSPNGTAPWQRLATVGPAVFGYIDNTVGYNVTRHYRARVLNSVGPSGYSNIASARTISGVPLAPTGFIATAHATLQRVTMSWTPSNNAADVELQRSPDNVSGWVTIPTVDLSNAIDETVLYGQTWYYRVRCINAQGASDWVHAQATVFNGLPSAPTSPAAQAHVSNPQITITWSLGASVTTRLAHEVQRSSDGITWARLVDDLAGDAVQFVDTNLQPGMRRYYRVRARNAQGWGTFSSTVDATTAGQSPVDPQEPIPGAPLAPTNLVVSAPEAAGQLSLQWTDNANDELATEIQRSVVSSSGSWSPLTTLGANAITHLDTTVLPSQTAWYRVRMTNNAGPSLWSNVAYGTASADEPVYEDPVAPDVPETPSTLEAVAHPTEPQVTVTWENVADELSYDLQRGYIPIPPETEIQWAHVAVLTINATSYVDTAVQVGQRLAYRVRAVNENGASGWSPIGYATVLGGHEPLDPAEIQGFSVLAHATLDQISVFWDSDRTTAAGVVVDLQRSPNGVDNWVDLATIPPDTLDGQYVDSGVGWESSWFYRARARHDTRVSAWTYPLSATTVRAPGPLPPPTNLRAKLVVGTTNIEVTWEDNSNNEVYFLLQRSRDGGRTFENVEEPGVIPPNTERWIDDDGS